MHMTTNAVAAALLAVFAGCSPAKKELHIYTWSDYIAPDLIDRFEQENDCKVVIDTFDSNEAMYAKLKAGATGYDIIMPSSYQIQTMVNEGMLMELDHAKLPNVRKNFAKSFESQIVDPTFKYNVPYAVTYTGFMYLKNKMPEDVRPDTWDVLSRIKLRGRISLLDDQREVIGAGLMSLGYNINSRNPAEINAAVEQVLKWKANISKFDAESYKTEVANGVLFLGQGYSTDATQVIVGDEEAGVPAREDIGFALPKEGFTIAFDEMVISADSAESDLAHAFINFIYDGEVAKENMEYICGPNPVQPGIDALDEEYRNLIILPPEVIQRGQVLKGFDDDPAVLKLYNDAWDRIKASK